MQIHLPKNTITALVKIKCWKLSLVTATKGFISKYGLFAWTSTFKSTDSSSSTEENTSKNYLYRENMRTTSPNKDSLSLSCSRLKSWCRPLVGGCHHTGGKRPTKHWLQLQKIPLTENKSSSSSSPPTPSGLHLPDISTSHQMLFARSRRGPPSWENLKIPTPPPILSSLKDQVLLQNQ